MSGVPFTPIPSVRHTRPPYTSYWLTPLGAVFGWALAGIGLAAWIWWKAPLIDNDRPDLPNLP